MVRIIVVLAVFTFCACSGNSSKKEAATTADSTLHPATENRIDVSLIQFASAKDPVCGMPVTAGISDTLTVEGKTYGFCSPECKDEYEKTLASH